MVAQGTTTQILLALQGTFVDEYGDYDSRIHRSAVCRTSHLLPVSVLYCVC